MHQVTILSLIRLYLKSGLPRVIDYGDDLFDQISPSFFDKGFGKVTKAEGGDDDGLRFHFGSLSCQSGMQEIPPF